MRHSNGESVGQDAGVVSPSERRRLAAVRRFRRASEVPDATFDDLARLARDLFRTPIAAVNLVDDEHQVAVAQTGDLAALAPIRNSICRYTVSDGATLVVTDAALDSRLADHPLVVGAPHLRFYAGAPLRSEGGDVIGAVCIADVRPRKPLTGRERRLLESLARLAMDRLEIRRLTSLKRGALRLSATTPDPVVCWDAAGRITFWNGKAEQLFGFSRAEVRGRPVEAIVPGLLQPGAGTGAGGAARPAAGEFVARCKDGTAVPVDVTPTAWRVGSRDQFGATIRDLSERHRADERLRRVTHFDPLTGLPNRTGFLEAVQDGLSGSGLLSVLKIGLDRFRPINATLGMRAGDIVLREAAARVAAAAGPEALVARLGADEFGILLRECGDPLRTSALASGVMAALAIPFAVGGRTCTLTASIGTVLCGGSSTHADANAVLKSALLALHRAKTDGGARAVLFRPQLGQEADERGRLVEELRGALGRDEFELCYQPQVRMSDRRIVGAEALLRWRHPAFGLLSPAAFLPVLETTDLAADVGRWALGRACKFASALDDDSVRVAVNLFAAQLRDSRLEDGVRAALAEAGLAPERLELEITETTVLGLDGDAIAPLRALRASGIGLAFDDYGTGFASLSLLKRYPVTRLKIDREFVRDLALGSGDAAIIRAVLALGTSMNLDVTAEGIETEEQAAFLASFGCREGQGYLFGRPMSERDFFRLVAEQAQGSGRARALRESA